MIVSSQEVLRGMSARSLRLFEPRGGRGVVDAEVDRSRLLVTSSELQAAATVLVMLDLIDEDDAEGILVEHRRALEGFGVHPRGVGDGELTLRPTSAYGFQAARRRPPAFLAYRPVTVAAPNVTVVVPDFEVLVEWLAVAQGGVRGRGVITATAPSVLPASQIDVVIPCVDDTGGAHELRARAGTLGVTVTPPSSANAVSTTAEISIEPALPVSVAWIELQPPGSASPVRVDLHSPATLLSGRSEPPWPTPAEWFLDDLLPDLIDADPGASFGVGLDAAGVRQVGAAVADALLAVGALPPASPLLAGYPQRYGRWHHELTRRYTARANRDLAAGRPRHVAAVGAAVALEHAVAVFDAVVILGRDVWLHLYVSPDAVGEYWPGIFRPFRIDATDDLGHQHQTVPATRWWYDHQGIGDLWLWPPLEPAARALRLTVSTPWEAAWIEIPLPTD